jgi:hypothetical protein
VTAVTAPDEIRAPAGPRPADAALRLGIGADHLARVRDLLDGDRLEVIPWQQSAAAYIVAALGMGEVPPTALAAARVPPYAQAPSSSVKVSMPLST